MNWYETSYRRHLLDMHINDWGDELFLSQFDPDVYVDNLVRGNVRSAMIYMQSHVGYCYFPTKTGAFRLTVRKGFRVTLESRFSKDIQKREYVMI